MESTGRTGLNPTTEWRPVVGHEGLYEVSDSGHLKGLPRVTHTNSKIPLRMIKGTIHPKTGYTQFKVSVDGVIFEWLLHRLVCEAFHGPPTPETPYALHRDGNPSNNTADNLYWGNQSQNNYDTVRHGKHFNASKESCPQGHPYDGENLVLDDKGWRKCRTCLRDSDLRRNPRVGLREYLHGERRTYIQGCRCPECSKSNSDYLRQWKEARKGGV